MEPQFWLDCWQKDQLGFQLEQAHPLLVEALLQLPSSGAIFVPLCGKTPDMHLLASRGVVIGAELSEIACRDFFLEAGLSAKISQLDQFTCHQAGHFQLWQGDFFQLPVSAVANCTLIYDRAALIALPPLMQQRYVDQLRYLMPSATMLLISLEYPEAEKSGPPFSVNAARVAELFEFADIQPLQQLDLTGQGFARRRFNTSSLVEQSWLIRWG